MKHYASVDVTRWAAELGMEPISVVVRGLRDGETVIEIEPDRALYPASMIKTPLAAVTYSLVERGALALDDTVAVSAENMTANDKASPLAPGYRARIAELVELMLTRSDNVATNVLYDVTGRKRATTIAQDDFGLGGTAFYRKLSGGLPLIDDPEWDGVHRNTHPAADAARLFSLIGSESIPGALQLRETLMAQEWNDKLTRGLGDGDRFAHKTGDTDEVTHDGGILYTGQGSAYVVIVYTGMPSTPENNEKFGPFMDRLRTLLR